MSEEIKEKFYGGEAAAREAFEELCAMVDQINVSFGSERLDERWTSELLKTDFYTTELMNFWTNEFWTNELLDK